MMINKLNKQLLVCSVSAIMLVSFAGCTHANSKNPAISTAAPAVSDKQSTPEPSNVSKPVEASKTSEGETLLKDMFELSKKGMIPDCDFQSKNTHIDQVTEKLGSADKVDAAGSGLYATYSKKGVTFGFNKGGQVFDVRSFSSNLQKVKYNDAEKALGKPTLINQYNNQDIMIYDVNIDYQFMLIFPKPTSDNPNPTLDHTSVFCLQASRNLMAENLDTSSDRYKVAGIDNAAEFEKMFNTVKDLVAKGDAAKVADYINYPINVYIDGNRIPVSTKEQFIANYNKIFTPRVTQALINQDVKTTFVNYKGVMVGKGEIWFSSINNKYLIYGINNDIQ